LEIDVFATNYQFYEGALHIVQPKIEKGHTKVKKNCSGKK